MAPTERTISPVTVGSVKSKQGQIVVDCLNCSYFEEVGFDGFHDEEIVIDLPRRRNWQYPRCGCSGKLIQARPKYYFGFDDRKFIGLTKKD